MEPADRPSRFDQGLALVVGISNYKVEALRLSPAVSNDADDFAALLTDAAYCGFPEGNIRKLLDHDATLDGVRDGLTWLEREATGTSTVVIMFSGHGAYREDRGMLCTHEFDNLAKTPVGLSEEEFSQWLTRIPAERLLVVLDACHANGLASIKDAGAPHGFQAGLSKGAYERLHRGKGRALLASCEAEQKSYVQPDARNSDFMSAVLSGLKGKAVSREGMIHLDSLFNHISESFSRNPRQTPVLKSAVTSNFPIALSAGALQRPSLPSDWTKRAIDHLEHLGSEARRIRQLGPGERAKRLMALAERPGELPHIAHRFLRAAAASGSHDAFFELGRQALEDHGQPFRVEWAELWWRQGAERGCIRNMYRLGTLLKDTGRPAEGQRFIRGSADGWYSPARLHLAIEDAQSSDGEARRRARIVFADLASSQSEPELASHALKLLRSLDAHGGC